MSGRSSAGELAAEEPHQSRGLLGNCIGQSRLTRGWLCIVVFASHGHLHGKQLGLWPVLGRPPGRCRWGALLWLSRGMSCARMDRAAGAEPVLALWPPFAAEEIAQFRGAGEVGLVRKALKLVARIEAVLPWCRRVEGPAPWRRSRGQCNHRLGGAAMYHGEIRRNERAGARPPPRPPCRLESPRSVTAARRKV